MFTNYPKIRSAIFLLSILTLPIPAWSSSCTTNDVRLQVLGSGGPELNDQRASTSYLIWINNKASLLIDSGSGSSLNFEKSGAKFEDLQAVVFTHLHVDHSADFPAYIKGSFFTSRERDLPVYGPEGNNLMPSTSEFVQSLLGTDGAFRYLNNYVNSAKNSNYHIQTYDVPLEKNKLQLFRLTDSVSLEAIPVHHGPISAIAWRANIFDCSITFSGDMSNRYQTLATLAKDTDILVMHNAIPESATGVARKLHMSPSEIGKIASESRAKKVILSHRMLRTTGNEQETQKIIEQYYSGPIIFADDLDIFTID